MRATGTDRDWRTIRPDDVPGLLRRELLLRDAGRDDITTQQIRYVLSQR